MSENLTLSNLPPAFINDEQVLMVRPVGGETLTIMPAAWSNENGAVIFLNGNGVGLSRNESLRIIEALSQALQR